METQDPKGIAHRLGEFQETNREAIGGGILESGRDVLENLEREEASRSLRENGYGKTASPS